MKTNRENISKRPGPESVDMEWVWAMPSEWTFEIPPIKELIGEIHSSSELWIDPFAGKNSPADETRSKPRKRH